jgi:GcrA cell cycle regulator
MGVIKWTDEHKAILHRLWVDEGMAASVIAARLSYEIGRPVTRNAVIGIAHRSGWALGGVERVRRQAANKGNGVRRKKRKLMPAGPKQSPLARLMAEPFVPRTAPITPLLLDIQDLGDDQCRYPCTDGPPNSHRFCGREKVVGLPYCHAHSLICFVPPQQMPRDRASLASFGDKMAAHAMRPRPDSARDAFETLKAFDELEKVR